MFSVVKCENEKKSTFIQNTEHPVKCGPLEAPHGELCFLLKPPFATLLHFHVLQLPQAAVTSASGEEPWILHSYHANCAPLKERKKN